MESLLYNVIFSGEIVQGHTLTGVKKSLQTIFPIDEQQIELLFTGQPVYVKHQVDLQTAERFQAAFQQAGAVCRIEPDTPPPSVSMSQSLQSPAITAPSMATQAVSMSPPPSQPDLSNCPKCGYQLTSRQDSRFSGQSDFGECPSCGIVVEKYKINADHAPASLSNSTGETARVNVEATFYPLIIDLFFFKPQIEIDGQIFKGAWWKQLHFPVPAGKHTIRIFFLYFFRSKRGENSVTFTIREGEIYNIRYFMWPLMFMKGSISAKKWKGPQRIDQLLYASFGKRCLAGVIDLFIALSSILALIYVEFESLFLFFREDTAVLLAMLQLYGFLWPYFACFESSIWQATPGKRLLNLKIMRADGARLTFLQATARFFSKSVLSTVLSFYAGIIMVAFTKKRQGLHDLIMKTIVVNEE